MATSTATKRKWPDVLDEQRPACPDPVCKSRDVRCTFTDSKYGPYITKRLYLCKKCGLTWETHEQYQTT